MKSFKFRYSITVWVLLSLILVISVLGLAWNVFNIIHFKGEQTFKVVSYYAISAITVALSIFVISVMTNGRYVIKNGYLYTCFGFVKNRTQIKDVIGLTHFKKSNKLVAYFKDNEYTVIVIAPEEYDKFILTVREVNPSITYSAQIDGEDTPS